MDVPHILKISYSQTMIIYRNSYIFYLYILNSITTKIVLH